VFILLILKVSATLNYEINTVNDTHKSSKITTKSSFNTITKITEKTEITVKIKDNTTNYSYFKLDKVNNMLKYFSNNKKVINNKIVELLAFVKYINKKILKITKYGYLNTHNFLIFSELINHFV